MHDKIVKLLKKGPPLKAREIAKKTGLTRKSINGHLFDNTDSFVKDDSDYWSLIVKPELVVKFDKNMWVDCTSFEKSLIRSGSPLDSTSDSILFVVPEKCKIMLDAAARFLALCNQIIYDKKAATIDFNDCRTTLSYFDRIGFFEHLDVNVQVLPQRPILSRALVYKGNSDAVVEFGAVNPRETNKTLINQLTDCFVQQSDNCYETAASTVFAELIGNIKEHSKSLIPGFSALQKYEGRRKHIQTVISDSGLGIAATLKTSLRNLHPELYKYHNDDDYDLKLVNAVLTKGGISRFGSGRGLGFKTSREQAIKIEAHLSVRQENFSLDIRYKNGKKARLNKQINLATIRGTHLCFDFFID